MKWDVFFSICQTDVEGHIPNEKTMFRNFLDQAVLADKLGYGTAWVAETHLSCQVQKQNPGAVIPNFQGEIGLNTDVLQLGHVLLDRTENIKVGSAIRNILCNGGPMAHAEAVKTFLSLRQLAGDHRALELGFASGRFPFSNTPYGIVPRDEVERSAWPALRGKIFMEATEILLRFLRGDVFSSGEVGATVLRRSDFRSDEDFAKVAQAWQRVTGESAGAEIPIRPRWTFDKVGVIPFEAPLENLRLTIGAHWAEAQRFANEFLPVGVFNLSITPAQEIEDTHRRMLKYFNSQGGAWTRDRMPRTVLVFVNDDAVSLEEKRRRAQEAATMATTNYWRAIEGTLDPGKVTKAVDNALVGAPEDLIEQIHQRFHPEDRMMLWFDFNNHDSEAVQNSMRIFMEKIAPKLKDSSR